MADEFDEDDLLADLDKALDGEANETPKQALEREPSEPKEYVRDGRRFTPKAPAKDEPVAAVAEDEAKPEVKLEAETPAVAPKAWKPLWYKEEYGDWEKLGEPLRKALEAQEKSAAKAIEERAGAVKQWEPLNQAVAPHAAELAAAGLTPQQYFMNLMDYDKQLRDPDPVSRVDALDRLASSLGLDLVAVGEWLAKNGTAPAPDPRDQRIEQLEKWKQQQETQGQQQSRQRLEQEINTWAQDKPHFADVRDLMAGLARAPANAGASLDQLYEAAMRAHPQLHQRILEDKRKEEVARARAAGAMSPRTGLANGATGRTKPTMTLEEELGMHLDGGV